MGHRSRRRRLAVVLLLSAATFSGCTASKSLKSETSLERPDLITGSIKPKKAAEKQPLEGQLTPAKVQKAAGSLADSIDAALANSPELKEAEAEIATAAGEVAISRSSYLPTLDTAAGIASDGDQDYRVAVSQPIYDWGKTSADVKRAKFLHESETFKFQEMRQTVALDAALAHAGIQKNRELLKAADANIREHLIVKKLADARIQSGVSDTSESGTVDVRLGDANQRKIAIEADLNATIEDYLRLTGKAPTNLKKAAALPVSKAHKMTSARIDDAPSMKAIQLEALAAKSEEKIARKAALPKIAVEAFKSDDDQGVGVRVFGPNLNGFKTIYAARNAKRRAEAFVYRANAERRSINRKLRDFKTQAPIITRRQKLLTDQVKRQNKLVETYQDQFQLGQLTILEVLNAQRERFQTETDLINLRFQKLELEYEAAAAIGTLIDFLE